MHNRAGACIAQCSLFIAVVLVNLSWARQSWSVCAYAVFADVGTFAWQVRTGARVHGPSGGRASCSAARYAFVWARAQALIRSSLIVWCLCSNRCCLSIPLGSLAPSGIVRDCVLDRDSGPDKGTHKYRCLRPRCLYRDSRRACSCVQAGGTVLRGVVSEARGIFHAVVSNRTSLIASGLLQRAVKFRWCFCQAVGRFVVSFARC
jgi:hypothetical protein